jgi:uncharacterized protein
MKKKIITALLALMLCSSFVVFAFASSDDYVVDDANVLTRSEEEELNEKLQDFAENYKSEIVIVTVDDLGFKSARRYADDFYDDNGYGYGADHDGMLVLYKDGEEGDREIYIYTSGKGVEDYDSDEIIDSMIGYLEDGEYVEAFEACIETAERAHRFYVDPVWIIISIALGMIIGFVIPNAMASGNKSVRLQRDASVYARQGSMRLTGNADVFVNSAVTRVPKPKDNVGSGSTHRGSSGRVHGGGGRKF